MSVYFILISILLVLGIYCCEIKKGKIYCIFYLTVAGILLVMLSTFRYGIGFDYYSYQDIFETISSLNFQELFVYYKHEILYAYLNKIIYLLGGNYYTLLFCINSFIYFIAMSFIYRFSKLPWVSVFLYITLQFVAHNMNLVRQSIAVTFFLLAFPALVHKKFLPYLCFILLGALFHNSIFYLLPAYFLLNIKHTWNYVKIVMLLCFLSYFLLDPIIILVTSVFPRYISYINSKYWSSNSFIYMILPSIYLLYLFLFRKKMEITFGLYSENFALSQEKNKQGEINNICFNSILFTFFINLFITKHFILERFSVYFFVLAIIFLPEIAYIYYWKEKKKSYFVLLSVFLYGTIYFIFASKEGFHNVYPYISVFQLASRGR